jgi:hypothetical protein
MKNLKFPHALFHTLIVLSAFAIPASAAVGYPTSPGPPPVTFVSASGTDTGSCWQTQPCATFQYAASQTLSGGEVDALTPGDFAGATGLTIGQSVTIDGKGMATMNAPAVQAITVNSTYYSTVVLRGLSINGTGMSALSPSGVDGIHFSSPGATTLVVENCTIVGFTNGINNVSGAGSTLYVKNTTIVGANVGVHVNQNGGHTILERVAISGAGAQGVEVVSTPGALTMNDSSISGGTYGVYVDSSAASTSSYPLVQLERTTITAATTAGIYTAAGIVNVDSSSIFNNALAMQASGGSLRISNNNIYDNTNGIVCNNPNSFIQSAGDNRHSSNVGITASGGCQAKGTISYW